MIRETYQAIEQGEEIRKNLILLRQELKEGQKSALLYYMNGDTSLFKKLLQHEDAKVRKNVALIMGELACEDFLQPLYEAYCKETTLFVRSSYLTAIGQFDYRELMPELTTKLEELNASEVTDENQKHWMEELRALSDLVVSMQGKKPHAFRGYDKPQELVLLTNRDQVEVTKRQLKSYQVKTFGAGVMVKGSDLKPILEIRTFEELLFCIPDKKTCSMDALEAAKEIVSSQFLSFLKQNHQGKVPFYFRIECKSKMPLEKKSVFTKTMASKIEQMSNRELINSTSNYEVELRLIENKEGKFNVLVKLYTLKDKRFSYRQEFLPTSIRPVNAALTVELAKEYLVPEAQVLDPFCGVGTMLIERYKAVKASSTYGVDCFGEAIEKARINTELAGQLIHYINRDFFDFTHDYLFDEVITDMPFALGQKSQLEIDEIYARFFTKIPMHLSSGAVMVLYSHDRKLVQTFSKKNFIIEECFEISRREGIYVFVLKYK